MTSEGIKKEGLIRWSGLIAFVITVAVLAGLWLLVVDGVVKRLIERTGTAVVGAKVELDAVDVTLFPLGATLKRLQVTDPDAPMQNVVEVADIAFGVEPLQLLRRKVIIQEMAMEGIQLGTPRRRSGAVTRKAGEEPGLLSNFALPSLSVPDVKEVLQKEDLQSVKLVESARVEIQAESERWRKRLAELPDKAKIEGYRKRIEGLKSAGKGIGGALGGAGEALKIQQELSRDLEQIARAKKDLEQATSLVRQRMEEAINSPQADIKRLREKYSLSGSGFSNAGMLLFGPRVARWAEKAFLWHERLEPALNHLKARKGDVEVVKPVRGKGLDVRFKEHAPLPDFLIRRAAASVQLSSEGGGADLVSGLVRNITPDQHILGEPLTFQFQGDKLKKMDSVKLDGMLNRVDPDKARDTLAFQARGYRVMPTPLAKTNDIAVELKRAVVDLDARVALVNGRLQTTATANAAQVQLTGQGSPDSMVAKAIASALAGVNGFVVKAEVAGTHGDYDIHLASNLDHVLGDAVGRQLREQAAKFEAQLQAAISERVSGPLSDLRTQAGGLDQIVAEMAGRLNLGNDVLKSVTSGKVPGLGGLKLPF